MAWYGSWPMHCVNTKGRIHYACRQQHHGGQPPPARNLRRSRHPLRQRRRGGIHRAYRGFTRGGGEKGGQPDLYPVFGAGFSIPGCRLGRGKQPSRPLHPAGNAPLFHQRPDAGLLPQRSGLPADAQDADPAAGLDGAQHPDAVHRGHLYGGRAALFRLYAGTVYGNGAAGAGRVCQQLRDRAGSVHPDAGPSPIGPAVGRVSGHPGH